jgi:manganese/zinc/iron transport system substrate-binding protein
MSRHALVIASMLASLLACTQKAADAPAAPGAASKSQGAAVAATPSILTTTGMIADLARAIAGKHATVSALMGPGTDPHLYKAREKDMSELARADLILYNGLHLEGKLGEALERFGRRKPVRAVTDGIDKARLRFVVEGNPDPHLWFDVALWAETVPGIVEALSEVLPSARDDFRANGETLIARLKALDSWVRTRIQEIPESSRILVTPHDAFGYFAKAYGLEVRAIQGLSTEDEAGVRDVNSLVDSLTRDGVRAVFVESTTSRKNIESLVEGCRARGHNLVIGGELYSDAMGAAGTPAGTYEGMVRHNVDTIVDALK